MPMGSVTQHHSSILPSKRKSLFPSLTSAKFRQVGAGFKYCLLSCSTCDRLNLHTVIYCCWFNVLSVTQIHCPKSSTHAHSRSSIWNHGSSQGSHSNKITTRRKTTYMEPFIRPSRACWMTYKCQSCCRWEVQMPSYSSLVAHILYPTIKTICGFSRCIMNFTMAISFCCQAVSSFHS